MNGATELELLGSYAGFFLLLGFVLVLLAPLLILRSSARTNRLLRGLMAEQERTTDLLALLVKQQAQQAGAGEDAAKNHKAFTLEEE